MTIRQYLNQLRTAFCSGPDESARYADGIQSSSSSTIYRRYPIQESIGNITCNCSVCPATNRKANQIARLKRKIAASARSTTA